MVRQTFYENIAREEREQEKAYQEELKRDKSLSFKGFLKTIGLTLAGNEAQIQADLKGQNAMYYQAEGKDTTPMETAEIAMAFLGAMLGGRGAKSGRAAGMRQVAEAESARTARRTNAYQNFLSQRLEAEKQTGTTRMQDLTREDVFKAHEELFGYEPGTSEFRTERYKEAIDAMIDQLNNRDIPARNAYVKTFLKGEKQYLEEQLREETFEDRKQLLRNSIEDIDFQLEGFDAVLNARRAAELKVELRRIDKLLDDELDGAKNPDRLAELETERQKINNEYNEASQESNSKYEALEQLHKTRMQDQFQSELNAMRAKTGKAPRSAMDDIEAYKNETGKNPTFDLDTTDGRGDWFEWRREFYKRLENDPETIERETRRQEAKRRQQDFEEEEEKADEPEGADDWFKNNVEEEFYDAVDIDPYHETWYDAETGDATGSPEVELIDLIAENNKNMFADFVRAEIDPDVTTELLQERASKVDLSTQKGRDAYEKYRREQFDELYGEAKFDELRNSGVLKSVYDLLAFQAEENLYAYNRRVNALRNKVRSTKNLLLDKEGELIVARYNNMQQRDPDAETTTEPPETVTEPTTETTTEPPSKPPGPKPGKLPFPFNVLPEVAMGTVPEEESTDEQGGTFTGTGKMAVRQILDRVNLDELLEKCLDLSLDTYNPDVMSSPEAFPNVNMYMNNRLDGKEFEIPFLIYTEGSELFVAFRGTSTLSNIVTDISTSALGQSVPNRLSDYDFPLEQHAGRLEVHGGFLKAVHETYNFMISRIKKVSVISQVHFTGHSAGAGTAAIAAYIYANDTDPSLPKLGYVVGFGSPRFLFDNEDYKEDYMKSVPKCIRVWNTRDPVPYLPFKKPVAIDFMGSRMASGFTHVGKSFDLTSNQVNCNINVLLYLILMGNKSKIKTLVEKMETAEANRMLDFMLSKDYQTLLMQGFLTCSDLVSVNKGYTQEDIDFVMEQLQGNTEKLASYADKCNLLRPYGLTDMMLANNLADDVKEENFSIPCMMGLCVGSNKTMTEAHRLTYYKEKLTELIDKQAAQQKFIYEVEDKDHEVFIPTNNESVKELAETSQTKLEKKIAMVRGLIFEPEKEMQMLNGQVIVY